MKCILIKSRTTVRMFLVSLILIASTLQLEAATTRSDIKILEAAEDIKFISQQIVKDYFYLSQNKQKQNNFNASMHQIIETLDDKLQLIATASKNEETRDLLTFLAYSSEQIKSTISEDYNDENGALMIDYGETLLEGAESLIQEYSYTFSTEEKMFTYAKKISYLIERMSKYYMAYQAGFNEHNNIQQLTLAIQSFNDMLTKFDDYQYMETQQKVLTDIRQYWYVSEQFYLNLEKTKLSNILYISSLYLEGEIAKLELYHSKNQ